MKCAGNVPKYNTYFTKWTGTTILNLLKFNCGRGGCIKNSFWVGRLWNAIFHPCPVVCFKFAELELNKVYPKCTTNFTKCTYPLVLNKNKIWRWGCLALHCTLPPLIYKSHLKICLYWWTPSICGKECLCLHKKLKIVGLLCGNIALLLNMFVACLPSVPTNKHCVSSCRVRLCQGAHLTVCDGLYIIQKIEEEVLSWGGYRHVT